MPNCRPPADRYAELNAVLNGTEGAVYLADVERYRENALRFLSAFQSRYPNTNLGYSYKTNYLPLFCREAQRLGLYAEVVSGTEYQMARHCGVPHDRIIFNGPVKTKDDLSIALTGRALVNIDSLDELDVLDDLLAGRPELSVRVGLRCNLELRVKDRPSRFGLSEENGDLHEAARRLDAIPQAELVGLHSHFSYDRSKESYRDRITAMVRIADDLFPDTPPDYLDLGGGFCGPLPPALVAQRGWTPPTCDEYADAIASVLAERYGPQAGPELILEPGVGLIADTLEYACRVETIKRFCERNVAVTSGSIGHLKIVDNPINLPLTVLSSGEDKAKQTRPCDIVGFTCLEHDVLYRDCADAVQKGNILVFSNVGAYSFVAAASFIRTPPPIMTRSHDGTLTTVMKKLSVVDLMSRFS